MKKLLPAFRILPLLVLFFAACSDFEAEYPDSAQESSITTRATGPEEKDYYWSGGEKIWLETDSAQMTVGFDNEQESKAFAAKTSQAIQFAGRAMILVDIQNEKVKERVSVEKSVKNGVFAQKFSGYDTPFYLTGV
ncbi:MAG: hypothetical protein LBU80_02880 [Rikenellaceae bacterium]|jgi:hypothetical protein|nr:hypothetical protein [Rikenellaceae bacterium]